MATTRFLVRAINCYLVGLSAESLVMCRAVLENAVNDKYAERIRRGQRMLRGATRMKARIDGAVRRHWLTPTQGDQANQVWLRGNKAVHVDPESVGSPLESLT